MKMGGNEFRTVPELRTFIMRKNYRILVGAWKVLLLDILCVIVPAGFGVPASTNNETYFVS